MKSRSTSPSTHSLAEVFGGTTSGVFRGTLAAARQGYTEGAIDFLNVISVQAALLQSQSQLVNVDTEINTRLVGLYRSLGGGWEIAN